MTLTCALYALVRADLLLLSVGERVQRGLAGSGEMHGQSVLGRHNRLPVQLLLDREVDAVVPKIASFEGVIIRELHLEYRSSTTGLPGRSCFGFCRGSRRGGRCNLCKTQEQQKREPEGPLFPPLRERTDARLEVDMSEHLY